MTDKTKPISASNPPESKGTHEEQVVSEPLVVDEAGKKLTPKKAPLSKKSLDEPKGK